MLISLPLVGFNSLFMTTDAPLFFFWGLATYALWRAFERNGWVDWPLVGTAAGFYPIAGFWLTRRRRWLVGGIILGLFVGYIRMATKHKAAATKAASLRCSAR